MPIKLSHSAVSKYQECPTAYKYHYIDKYRSKTKSGALFFGSAIDRAMEHLLTTGSGGLDVFEKEWLEQEHNGKRIQLPLSTEVVYAESDYDEELLLPEDLESIHTTLNIDKGVNLVDKIDSIYKQKKAIGYDLLSRDNKILLNLANWKCLRRKGHAMMKTLEKEVVPKIKRVLGTQQKVELINEEGDSVVGYADLICEFEGYDGPIIFDLKTSARPYDEDSVLTSPQLALYTWGLYDKFKTKSAGFIVLSKAISKNKQKICSRCFFDGSGSNHKTCPNVDPVKKSRCHGDWEITINPKASVQILVDTIPDRVQNMVVENFNDVNHAIKSNNFTRNLQSCIKPYGKCPFYNVCWKGTEEGLIKNETSS